MWTQSINSTLNFLTIFPTLEGIKNIYLSIWLFFMSTKKLQFNSSFLSFNKLIFNM